jgi:hypothetical protein
MGRTSKNHPELSFDNLCSCLRINIGQHKRKKKYYERFVTDVTSLFNKQEDKAAFKSLPKLTCVVELHETQVARRNFQDLAAPRKSQENRAGHHEVSRLALLSECRNSA